MWRWLMRWDEMIAYTSFMLCADHMHNGMKKGQATNGMKKGRSDKRKRSSNEPTNMGPTLTTARTYGWYMHCIKALHPCIYIYNVGDGCVRCWGCWEDDMIMWMIIDGWLSWYMLLSWYMFISHVYMSSVIILLCEHVVLSLTPTQLNVQVPLEG